MSRLPICPGCLSPGPTAAACLPCSHSELTPTRGLPCPGRTPEPPPQTKGREHQARRGGPTASPGLKAPQGPPAHPVHPGLGAAPQPARAPYGTLVLPQHRHLVPGEPLVLPELSRPLVSIQMRSASSTFLDGTNRTPGTLFLSCSLPKPPGRHRAPQQMKRSR